MKPIAPCILTINGGSSSIKFGVYPAGEPLKRGLYGTVDRIGMTGTNLTGRTATASTPPTTNRRRLF